MKKKINYSLLLLILMASIMSTRSYGEACTNQEFREKVEVVYRKSMGKSQERKIKIKEACMDIRLYFNGEAKNLEFPLGNSQGYTLIGLRDIGRILGFNVDWNNELKRVELTSDLNPDHIAIFPLNRDWGLYTTENIYGDYFIETSNFNLPTSIYQGRTYLPLRDVIEMMGLRVDWDQEELSINIRAEHLDQYFEDDYQVEEFVSDKNKDNKSLEFKPVAIKDLDNLKSIKKNMTDQEMEEAYNFALKICEKYVGLSLEEQLSSIAYEIRLITDASIEYTMENKHYNNPYGFFILNHASCAGATRATGLCLNILAIEYEHVNENKWSH